MTKKEISEYLSKIGRLGGKQTSPKKLEACRRNGQKGGLKKSKKKTLACRKNGGIRKNKKVI